MTAESVRQALYEVSDPEIPTISIVDLGIVTKIETSDTETHVTLTPTFAGCPALRIMERLVENKLKEKGFPNPKATTSFDVQWNTGMISEEGLQALKKHGLAPPPPTTGNDYAELLKHMPCPYCDSKNTELKSPFGPTLCRSIHYCNDCHQSFEAFKPVK
ncbi:MAG: phenylacetate-CoA oxygenase subunit PaaJ [Bacteroidetes bacterium]|nr:phenylacetate-CoA oxygenase subunit PaaJ [Bacteroidota bacterium]